MLWDRKSLLGYVEIIQLMLGVTDKNIIRFICVTIPTGPFATILLEHIGSVGRVLDWGSKSC